VKTGANKAVRSTSLHAMEEKGTTFEGTYYSVRNVHNVHKKVEAAKLGCYREITFQVSASIEINA
jgi:hypothetical protein